MDIAEPRKIVEQAIRHAYELGFADGCRQCGVSRPDLEDIRPKEDILGAVLTATEAALAR